MDEDDFVVDRPSGTLLGETMKALTSESVSGTNGAPCSEREKGSS